jgi:hypothetical protein
MILSSSMMSKNWVHIRMLLFLFYFTSITVVLLHIAILTVDLVVLCESRLVCTALYNDGDAERKYLPQFFKFTVSNPLSVRTKVL